MHLCPNCNTILPPQAEFCSQCGTTIAPDQAQKSFTSPLTPSYTPSDAVLGNTNRLDQHATRPHDLPTQPNTTKIAYKIPGQRERMIGCAAIILALILLIGGGVVAFAFNNQPTPSSAHVTGSPSASTNINSNRTTSPSTSQPTATATSSTVTRATVVLPTPTAVPTTTGPTTPPVPFTVTGVSATVDTTSYTGSCSNGTTLHFTGTISAPKGTAGGTVTYDWVRSNGTSTASQTATFAASVTTQNVTNAWTLQGTDMKSGTYWETLQVSTPTAMTSQQASYTATCQTLFTVTAVSASITPAGYKSYCTKGITLHFTGTISVPAGTTGGTVTYDWVRSNGTSSASQTATFAAGVTSQTVTNVWALSTLKLKSGIYWEALQISSPVALTSDHANYTLTCEAAFTVTNVSASASPTSFQGYCTRGITLHFSGTISAPSDTTGGTPTARQIVTFTTGTTSQTVANIWVLSAFWLRSGTYWETLQVNTPVSCPPQPQPSPQNTRLDSSKKMSLL